MPGSLPTHEAKVIVTGDFGSGTGPAPLLALLDDPLSDELPQPAAMTAATSTASVALTPWLNTLTSPPNGFAGADVNVCARPRPSFPIASAMSRAQDYHAVQGHVGEHEPVGRAVGCELDLQTPARADGLGARERLRQADRQLEPRQRRHGIGRLVVVVADDVHGSGAAEPVDADREVRVGRCAHLRVSQAGQF